MTLQFTADVVMTAGIVLLVLEKGWGVLKNLRDSKPTSTAAIENAGLAKEIADIKVLIAGGNGRGPYATQKDLTAHAITCSGELHNRITNGNTEITKTMAAGFQDLGERVARVETLLG